MARSRDYHFKPRVKGLPGSMDDRVGMFSSRVWEVDCQACDQAAWFTSFAAAQRYAASHLAPPRFRLDGSVFTATCTPDTRMKRLTERHISDNRAVLNRLADL
jgi:hypothetical protein